MKPTHGPESLTRREWQVIFHALEGLRNRAVGNRMGLNENVIRNYMRSIHDKLGTSSRLELSMWGTLQIAGCIWPKRWLKLLLSYSND